MQKINLKPKCLEIIEILGKEVIMEQNNELKLFEDKKIRAKWDDE